jgi:hypothetical protein
MLLTLTPPRSRFQRHVSFDNFAAAKPTEKNFPSLTLYAKHKGYAFKRQSRTFMVGVDENEYSDIALQWLLDEMVDEGDEVICVRVIEEDSKKLNYRNLEENSIRKKPKRCWTRYNRRITLIGQSVSRWSWQSEIFTRRSNGW